MRPALFPVVKEWAVAIIAITTKDRNEIYCNNVSVFAQSNGMIGVGGHVMIRRIIVLPFTIRTTGRVKKNRKQIIFQCPGKDNADNII